MTSDRFRFRFGLRHRSKDEPRQRGETLIEVITTVALLSTAVIAIVTLMMTLLVSTNLHRRHVKSAIDATLIAESIERATYLPCTGSLAGYNSVLPAQTGPYGYSIESIQFLTAASMAAPTGVGNAATTPAPAYSGSCPGTGDQGAQKITVLVSSVQNNTVQERVVLVKRNDTCPVTVATIAGQTC